MSDATDPLAWIARSEEDGKEGLMPEIVTNKKPIEQVGRVKISQEKLVDFCRRNHIRFLALFGSVLRNDFRPDSDIDVLVDFVPGHVPGFGLIRMQDELSALFGGREIDLVTLKFLHPRIRAHVLSEMVVQYAQ